MIETGTIVIQALSEALETMAFQTILPIEEDLLAPEEAILAEMNFNGPKSGTVQILAGLDFAKILAENIGALDEVKNENAFDALKELANVVCGLVIPVVASSQADVFDVTVPAIKSGDETPKWDQFVDDQASCVSNIEGFLVAARLTIED
jgi:hypothetical protein